ncbi:hypothetical protein ACFV0L_07805 [Streptosporangium canum]|uniref:hypothetical protein n=1 Tax=Streptosporangium canum TaxID=324952 RepID=UPI003696C2AC
MRSSVRIAWIAVGGALTALTVSGIALAGWSEVSRTQAAGDRYDTSLLRPATLSESSVREYTLTSPELVLRTGGRVNISIVPGTAGQISIKREIIWFEGAPGFSGGKPSMSEMWNGRTLQLTVGCPVKVRPRESPCRAEYTLSLPPATDVEASTDFGSVSARGVQGDLRLSTASGEVTVADVGGALRARAGSGKVTGTGLRSAVVDVEVGRGDAVLGFQRAPEDVRAVAGEGGDVEVTVPDGDGYRVDARAGRSVVEVRRDQEASRRITALAPEGELRILPYRP